MSKRPESLSDIVVVIAGASSGFGRGVAQELAANGARVVIAARRKSMLDDLVSEIETAGGAAIAVEADVSEPADIARLVERTLAHYRPDRRLGEQRRRRCDRVFLGHSG